MKKSVLLFFSIFSIINSINSIEQSKCNQLPKEIWLIVFDELKLIQNVMDAKTISQLKISMYQLMKFAEISKLHYTIVNESFKKKLNIENQKKLRIILNEFYQLRKKEIFAKIEEIKSELKLTFNAIFSVENFDNTFNWFVDINSQDPEYGWSPLIIAVFCKIKALVELILENDADVNIQDKRKFTALGHAVAVGNQEIVNLLSQRGAKIGIANISHIVESKKAREKDYKNREYLYR